MTWGFASPEVRAERRKVDGEAYFKSTWGRRAAGRPTIPQSSRIQDMDAIESGGLRMSDCKLINCTIGENVIIRVRGRCMLAGCTICDGADVLLDDALIESTRLSGKCSLTGTICRSATLENVVAGASEFWSAEADNTTVGDDCYICNSFLQRARIGSSCVVLRVGSREAMEMADGAMILACHGNDLDKGVQPFDAQYPASRSYISHPLVMGEGARLIHGNGSSLSSRQTTIGPGATLVVMTSCTVGRVSMGRRSMMIVNNTVGVTSYCPAGPVPENVDIRLGHDAFLKTSLNTYWRAKRKKEAPASIEVADCEAAVLV